MRVAHAFIFMSLALLSGCESITYYSQALSGQIAILCARKKVASLLVHPKTPEKLKKRLKLVDDVKAFAHTQLDLNTEDVFSYYADTKREYVVWNVFAAEEFSLEPVEWCFPVAGCVGYRGYFTKEAATKKAKSLKMQGYDVHVGGIRAYSTLGWFNDPLLNTFLFDEEESLIGLLIHELAHKQFYLQGDTAFNESFATAVEMMGVKGWYAQSNGVFDLSAQFAQEDSFNQFILRYFEPLNAIYTHASLSSGQKKQQKTGVFKQMLRAYDQQKQAQNWGNKYRPWLATINNAKLATVGNYHRYTHAFFRLRQLSQSNADFYQRVERLSTMPKKERDQALLAFSQQYGTHLGIE